MFKFFKLKDSRNSSYKGNLYPFIFFRNTKNLNIESKNYQKPSKNGSRDNQAIIK